MRLVLLMAIALALSFTACRDNITQPTTGTVELVFMPKYKGTPMVFFKNINTDNNSNLYFQKLEFFISELKAKQGNQVVNLADVKYVSMNDLITNELAEKGVTVTLSDIPVGSYEKLMFGVGVTDANNAKEPADFSSETALGRTGNYWASWNSYIFCKIEGQYTPQGSSSASSFLYHGGVDGMYQPLHFNKNFTVKGGETTKIMIHLHGEDLFFKTGATIDLVNDNTTHSGAQGSAAYNLAKQAITNLANALHIH